MVFDRLDIQLGSPFNFLTQRGGVSKRSGIHALVLCDLLLGRTESAGGRFGGESQLRFNLRQQKPDTCCRSARNKARQTSMRMFAYQCGCVEEQQRTSSCLNVNSSRANCLSVIKSRLAVCSTIEILTCRHSQQERSLSTATYMHCLHGIGWKRF